MKNTVKLLLGCVAAAGIVLPASAQITLSLSPSSQNVGLNGLASYNLNISGLKSSADYSGPALGGFTVQLDYNSMFALAQPVTFGTKLNLSGNDYQYSDLSAAGQIYLTETSFDSAAALEQAQTSSFTLATFTFQGLAMGTTPLTFDIAQTSLSDENGNTLDLITANPVSLSVVPEPACGGLAALALGLCGLRRKLTRASHSKS